MTDPHPQPEYIITETQIKTILILINRDMEMDADEFEIIAKELRSRPHTPAAPATDITIRPAPGTCCPEPPCDSCKWMQEHDAAIRKAEREKVLDYIINLAIELPFDDDGVNSMNTLSKWIESLRGGAEQGGSER